MYRTEPYQESSKRRKKRNRSRSGSGNVRNVFSQFVDILLWCEPLWIALLSPLILFAGMFFAEEFLPFIISALFLFWPIRLLTGRKLLFPSPHNGFLWILLLWLPIPFLVSTNKMLSWQAIGYLLLGLAAYVAITNWTLTQKRPELIALAICTIGIALAVVGPRLIERVPTKLFETSDLTIAVENSQIDSDEAINSNVLAGGLLISIPFLLAFALTPNALAGKKEDASSRGWSVFVAVLSAIALVAVVAVLGLAQSRGAYIATAVTACLVLLLRWPRSWPIISLLVLAGTGLIYWVDLGSLIGYSVYNNSINSFSGRTDIWQRAADLIMDFPFTGAGIGTFGEVVPNLYPYSIFSSSFGSQIPHAHNLLLQIGVDLGLLGLIATVGIFISALAIFINIYSKAIKAQKHNYVYVLAIGGIGAIVAIWIHGIFDAVTWGTKLAFLPWLVIALAALLQQPHLQPKRKRSSSGSAGV